MRRVRIVAGVVLALGLSATAAQARLEGKFRDTFIAGAQKSCLQKQKSDALNSGISESLLQGFCTCYSARIAEAITADQLALSYGDLQKGAMPDWMKSEAAEASKYCLSNLRNYVKSN
jgi:hypothetical protein